MACGLLKGIVDVVDELWKEFLDVGVERYGFALEHKAGVSTAEGRHFDRFPISRKM